MSKGLVVVLPPGTRGCAHVCSILPPRGTSRSMECELGVCMRDRSLRCPVSPHQQTSRLIAWNTPASFLLFFCLFSFGACSHVEAVITWCPVKTRKEKNSKNLIILFVSRIEGQELAGTADKKGSSLNGRSDQVLCENAINSDCVYFNELPNNTYTYIFFHFKYYLSPAWKEPHELAVQITLSREQLLSESLIMKLETLKQSLHFPGYLCAWNTSSLCSCVGTVDRWQLLIRTVVCMRFWKGDKKCKRSVSDLLLLSFSSNWFYSWLSMWYLFLAKNKNSLFLHPRLILGRCLGAPFASHWIGALFSGNGGTRGHPHTLPGSAQLVSV